MYPYEMMQLIGPPLSGYLNVNFNEKHVKRRVAGPSPQNTIYLDKLNEVNISPFILINILFMSGS